MDILFCTSEAYPLIKTGGLADVSGSLPQALQDLGNDVRLMLPAYPEAVERAGELTTVAELKLTGAAEPVRVLRGSFGSQPSGLYLVDSPEHFQRPGNPYVQEDGTDWPDNAQRFALFAKAVAALALGEADSAWRPELVHCNDWQTGLVPPLLSGHRDRPATLFTIHNLAYQGRFPASTFTELKLPAALWSMDGVEFNGMLSFLKGGIAMADWVTTVSPTYAREICTPAFGYDFAGLLQYRSDHLTGILNGMDCGEWNPATDPHLPVNYDIHTLQRKAQNKAALQEEQGLALDPNVLLIGHIGRLVEQKGVDLILETLDELLSHSIQLVVLGEGDPKLEQSLIEAATDHPDQLAVYIGYDEALAHRIEGACDAFLMPSRYEPCGLNQLYSLRYGTVPIVHRTGGLADSVVDCTEQSARDYSATGFSFQENTAEAVLKTCLRTLAYYRGSKIDWWKLVIAGMRKDFCWPTSALQYLELYWQLAGAAQDKDQASD